MTTSTLVRTPDSSHHPVGTPTDPPKHTIVGRWWTYLSEMFPLLSRAVVAAILFFEIHFLLLLNYGINDFSLGVQEAVGTWTVFAFLLMLRIADDLKDQAIDGALFAHRPLPSGRVKVTDLRILLWTVVALTTVLNVLFMNNLPFFAVLYGYGAAMSVWFFARAKIQPNLFIALITHNPVMMILNIYIISFGVLKYDLDPFTPTTFLLAWTMYFPSLIWEVARKIRSPKNETSYVTYSKLWGHRTAAYFILGVILVDVATNLALVFAVSRIAMIPLVLNVAWITWTILRWTRNPESFVLGRRVDRYIYLLEGLMVVAVAVFLMIGYH